MTRLRISRAPQGKATGERERIRKPLAAMFPHQKMFVASDRTLYDASMRATSVTPLLTSILSFAMIGAGCHRPGEAKPAAPPPAPIVPAAIESIYIESLSIPVPPDGLSTAWNIYNLSDEPFAFHGAMFNGEVPARFGAFDGKAYHPSAHPSAVIIPPHGSSYLYHSDGESTDYAKPVQFILFRTQAGIYKWDANSGGWERP
jgi:hypothetical protein